MRKLLYTIITFLLSLIMGIRLLCNERGRTRIRERFGSWQTIPDTVLWFHGASIGEMQGLIPIMERFKADGTPILCTVTSLTGVQLAETVTPYVRLLPFDCTPFIAFALRGVRIQCYVFAETEIWPSLFSYLARRQIPIIGVNGRISANSQKRYKQFQWLLGDWPSKVTRMLVSDSSSYERFKELGIQEEKLKLIGNSKYDREPLTADPAAIKIEFFGDERPLLVIGSIRPGEEKIIFPALKEAFLLGRFHCLVAPRHKEKFSYFEEKFKEYALPYVKWTKRNGTVPLGSVFLLNTIGELEKFYLAADGAIIGGSLVNYGGHNPLEPAPYGVAIACGPYTSSTGGLVEELVHMGAVERVYNEQGIKAFIELIYTQDERAKEMADSVYTYWAQNRGAVGRIEAEIREILV